mmetsp:Transcript_56806/g.101328  ORF Transcript_56806/g.101328 Transcript_56806/m.101328 type:complete len:272 (+) Transcript_56806:1232-2047(+)
MLKRLSVPRWESTSSGMLPEKLRDNLPGGVILREPLYPRAPSAALSAGGRGTKPAAAKAIVWVGGRGTTVSVAPGPIRRLNACSRSTITIVGMEGPGFLARRSARCLAARLALILSTFRCNCSRRCNCSTRFCSAASSFAIWASSSARSLARALSSIWYCSSCRCASFRRCSRMRKACTSFKPRLRPSPSSSESSDRSSSGTSCGARAVPRSSTASTRSALLLCWNGSSSSGTSSLATVEACSDSSVTQPGQSGPNWQSALLQVWTMGTYW